MLLEHGESDGKHTMIMVSQPRRIAVTALKRRLQECLGAKVGLRLGNGVRTTTQPLSSLLSLFSLFSLSSTMNSRSNQRRKYEE